MLLEWEFNFTSPAQQQKELGNHKHHLNLFFLTVLTLFKKSLYLRCLLIIKPLLFGCWQSLGMEVVRGETRHDRVRLENCPVGGEQAGWGSGESLVRVQETWLPVRTWKWHTLILSCVPCYLVKCHLNPLGSVSGQSLISLFTDTEKEA